MTGIAQTPPEPYLGTRTPHVFLATLLGAALILTTVLRFLGADPVPDHPLSGAPVDGAVEPTLSLPSEASAAVWASSSPDRLLAGVADFEPALVGPLAVPRDGALTLRLSLTTDEPTSVSVTAARMRLNGAVRDGEQRTYEVLPGADGGALLPVPVSDLIGDGAGGIHRLTVSWNGAVLAEEHLALAAAQPTGVAVFDEPRTVRIDAGRHAGRRFDAGGSVTAKKVRRAGRGSNAEAVAYARFNGTAHVLVVDGRWARHWLPLGEGVRLR
jgi:hypothetical protein